MNLKRTTLLLLSFRFFKIAFSIITLTLSAKYFGVSVDMDVWIIVSTAIATLNLAIWGPLNETFRAKFVYMREQEGEKATLYKVRSLLLFIFVVTTILSTILLIYSKATIPYLAPSLVDDQKQIFVSILILMIPSFMINEMISIGTSILNSYSVFYMPEIMGIISVAINLICIIFLASRIGIKSLIIAQYVSGLLLLFVIIIFINKSDIQLWSGGSSIEWKYIKPFIYFSIPFFLPYAVAQFNNILEKNLANSLGIGVVSILNYASQFKGIVQAVFTSVLASVIVPSLSMAFANKNYNDFAHILKENIQIVFISLSLIVPFIFGAAVPLVNILYNHEGMDTNSIEAIVHLTRLYSFSIISVMLYLIFGYTLLSQQQGYKYALYGTIAQVITIIANILLYKSIGSSIFPLSLLISHFLVSIFMFKHILMENKKIIVRDLGKYILLIAILSILLYPISILISSIIDSSFIQLTIDAIILFFFFLLFSKLIGFNVMSYISVLKGKLNSIFEPNQNLK